MCAAQTEHHLVQYDFQYYIRMSEVAKILKTDLERFKKQVSRYEWNKHRLECQTIDTESFISCKSAVKFLTWYLDKSYRSLPSVNAFKHDLVKFAKKIPKRALSRSMRVEIAYRQNYTCRRCKLFPIPPNFEVDHIVELQDGGRDVASNLQALCSQCRREKTRLNRLRKSSIFRDEVTADYEKYIQPAATARDPPPPRNNYVHMPKRRRLSPVSAEDTEEELAKEPVFSKYFLKK